MEKLDYIKDLGFDSIWLSPIYEVASIENGDDVINYMKINSDNYQDTINSMRDLLSQVD